MDGWKSLGNGDKATVHIFYNLTLYPSLLHWQISTQITFEIHLSLCRSCRHPSTGFILLLKRTVVWLKTEIIVIRPSPVCTSAVRYNSCFTADAAAIHLMFFPVFPWFVNNDTWTPSLGPTTPLIPEGAIHIMFFLLMVPSLGACWKSQSSANIRNAILWFPNWTVSWFRFSGFFLWISQTGLETKANFCKVYWLYVWVCPENANSVVTLVLVWSHNYKENGFTSWSLQGQ